MNIYLSNLLEDKKRLEKEIKFTEKKKKEYWAWYTNQRDCLGIHRRALKTLKKDIKNLMSRQ